MSLDGASTLIEMAIKEAQRKALRAKIQIVMKFINKGNELQRELNREEAKVSNSTSKWDRKYSAFQSSSMAAVMVTDKFEGDSAEIISNRLPDPIAEMNMSKTSANRVSSSINSQLSKLDTYIVKKENEKAELEAQLAAI